MALSSYAVLVLNSAATKIYPPAAGISVGGRRINIFNNGPNPIFVGPAGVTVLTGFPVAAGAAKDLLAGGDANSDVWAIAGTADQAGAAGTRVMIETGV